MTAVTVPSSAVPVAFAPTVLSAADDAVRTEVRKVLSSARPSRRYGERRSEQRYPFPYPVPLTPVDRDTLEPVGKPLVVLGKQLAERGLDFYHHDPLPYRYMLAELEYANGEQVKLLLELTWCRFTKHGVYENGGRFLQCVDEA